MYYSNAIFKAFSLISLILNLSNLIKCNKLINKNAILNFNDSTRSDQLFKNQNKLNLNKEFLLSKKLNCCSCNSNNCADKNLSINQLNSPIKLQTNLFQNKNTIQIDRHMDNSREQTNSSPKIANNNDFDVSFIDDKNQSNSKKRLKLDMSASIRSFVNQLRPQSPLHAFGVNGNNLGTSAFSQMAYAPISNNYVYGYRPISNIGLSNYGLVKNLDISPSYSDHFAPFISNGLGSSLGTPYGTGLGIGSSFGIYDNIYPNTISATKSTGLRRKLVPGEGILLLEVEDPLNPHLTDNPHETLSLNSGRININSIAKMQTLNRNNLGSPKFSIHLSSSNSATDSDDDSIPSFYSNSLNNNNLRNNKEHQNRKPNFTKENLINFEKLNKNPHLNQQNSNLFKSIKIFN